MILPNVGEKGICMILRNREVLLKAQNDANYMDELLKEKEVEKFIKFVIKSYTKNPARFMQQYQVDWEDLYQSCLLGLFNGINRLDMDKTPNEWIRYLFLNIQGEIRNFTRSNNSNSICVSQRIRALYPSYILFYQRYRDEQFKDPTIEDTMKEFDISRMDAFDLVYGMQQVISFFLEKDGQEQNLELLIQDHYTNVERTAINKVLIDTYMTYLDGNQKKVLIMYYYLGYSKTEIAKAIGCANSMVSKYMENAFKKIRKGEGIEIVL